MDAKRSSRKTSAPRRSTLRHALNVRVTDEMMAAIEREFAVEQARLPELVTTPADAVRILLREAIERRASARG